MKNKQPENDRNAQDRLHLHAIDVSILVASSFFWTWYQLAILGPTFFTPFGNMFHFDEYHLFAVFSTAVSLFFWHKKQDLALLLLNSRKWEILFVSLAVLGNGITVLGIYLLNPVVISLGGIIVGSMAAYFMLAWSRMYSRRGSRSTAASITGAFALSFVFGLLVSTMTPIASAVTTTILPYLVVLVLIGVQTLFYSTNNPDTDVSNALHENPDIAFGAADVLVKSRDKHEKNALNARVRKQEQSNSVKIPLALTLAFFVFGFAFGYDVHNAVQHQISLTIMIAGGLSGLILFIITLFKPEWLYGAFLSGILIGIAGYLLVPSLGLGDIETLCSELFITIGSITFFAASWTMLADMSVITKKGSIAVFVQGLFRCYIGAVLGYIFALAIQYSAQYFTLNELGLSSILGFVFVIGLLLLFVGNQSIWGSLKASLSNNTQVKQMTSNSQSLALKEQLEEVATTYRLTEREGEILELLAIGRSRTRIAQALYLSENTVNTHVQHIYRKMNVSNIQELLDFIL